MSMAAAAEAFDPTSPLPPTRREVQDAAAKAVELRALHAALRHRGGVSNAGAGRIPATTIRLPLAASPPSLSTTAAVAAEDYPVFTPAYDDEEAMAGLNDINHDDDRSRSENWSGITFDRGGGDDAAAFSDYGDRTVFSSSTDHLRSRGAYRIHPAFLQSAPLAGGRFPASAGRAERKTPVSCTSFRPATIGRDHDGISTGGLRFLSSSRAPLSTSSHQPSSAYSRPAAKHKGSQIISWLMAKTKKKPSPPTAVHRENMSQLLKEWGLLSLDSLRKELADANARRDTAQQDAAETRSSMAELTAKLLNLEVYCSELKKALRQATTTNNGGGGGAHSHSRRSTQDLSMPVSHEAMAEGFLQIASEARLSVKQFCKALIQQVDQEPDNGLSDKLNLLLQPYHLTIAGGGHCCSKTTLYHLESLMNQSMHEEFESCTFQKNGSPKWLDPRQERHENFASFVKLRNLSWNEVLRKGTKFYSEELSRFCDQKMSRVVSMLDWAWPWPEHLLQSFFVATKCVWLLHLLAFSFSPPVPILRVEENRVFDQMYMEDILLNKHQIQSPSRVKIMMMPGFYVQDRVLKCKVLTTRSAA